jgi:hypothetical protein
VSLWAVLGEPLPLSRSRCIRNRCVNLVVFKVVLIPGEVEDLGDVFRTGISLFLKSPSLRSLEVPASSKELVVAGGGVEDSTAFSFPFQNGPWAGGESVVGDNTGGRGFILCTPLGDPVTEDEVKSSGLGGRISSPSADAPSFTCETPCDGRDETACPSGSLISPLSLFGAVGGAG